MGFDLGHTISSISKLALRTKRKIDNDDMKKDYDYYKEYVSNIETSNNIYLNLVGFKKLISETLSNIIEKELGMKYLGNGFWATEYDNHRRKVLQIFLINNAYATLSWGYNFDFIPKRSGKKLSTTNTDRSIYSHIFEVSNDFYQNTINRKKTVMSNSGGKINDFNHSILEMKKNYIEVFKYLLPMIKEYYQKTKTILQITQDIEEKWNRKDLYYRLLNNDMKIVKVFIEAFYGNKEQALIEFEKLNFDDESIKKEYLLRLEHLE